jgi:hypothetical protein
MNRLFGGIEHIETPTKNASAYKWEILKKTKRAIKNENIEVVVLACGQLGRVMAGDLWRMRERFHCIDIGSMVDAFDGKGTRRWLRRTDAHENTKYFI